MCRIAVVKRIVNSLVRSLAGVAVVTVIVAFYRHTAPGNSTTVALTFLLAVLIVSATWGLLYAVFLAIIATLALNFFFLPPVGTFTIADSQNWIALIVFLATAIIASQLSERARREARQATQRRKEIERLYTFSQRLLTTENVPELLNAIPKYVVECFGIRTAAVFVSGRTDIYRSGPDMQALTIEKLKPVMVRGEPAINAGTDTSLAPIRLGVQSVGAIGVSGGLLSLETLEALGTLIAIAIAHTRAIEKLSKAEASRENEKLRSAILDSVTHEFRTPLTSIKASVTTLLTTNELDAPEHRELLTVIDEESDRLNRLIGEAALMAQLDANQVELHRQPHHIGEAIERALEESKLTLAAHPVKINLSDGSPLIWIDLERITDVLRQLLENAGKYSPSESPIHVSAESRDGELVVSVADHGPGIDDFEQALIFDKFYRGKSERYRVQGTGMGLAIAKAIIEAHGGVIGLVSQLGHGSVFHFSLPLQSFTAE